MLYKDNPARIASPGTFSLGAGAKYTVGRDHVQAALQMVLQRSSGIVGADIETFGLGLAARRLKSVTFSDYEGTHAVILDPRDEFQENLIRWGFGIAKKIIYHNSPFDVPNLYINDLISLEDIDKIDDTLIYCRLAEPGMTVPNNLADAMARYLNTPNLKAMDRAFRALGLSKEKGYRLFDLDRPIYLQGASEDPLGTVLIHPLVMQACYDRLTTGHPFHKMAVYGEDAWNLIEREQILNRDFLKRTCVGIRVDFEYLENYKAENNEDVARAEKELQELGIRPANGQDLVKYLDSIGEISEDHPLTKTGKYQADQKAVATLSHPVAKTFAKHKEITKVSNDYLEKVITLADSNGRIHPTTSFLKADTGRAAMADPPIHQFPPKARGIILFDDDDDGTSLDWSQIEPITIANWARDTTVLEAYESGKSDVYTALGTGSGMLPPGTTSAMCDPLQGGSKEFKGIRSQLKVVLLAQLYGEGLRKLTADLGLDPGPMRPPTQFEVEKRGFDPKKLYPDYADAKKLKNAVFSAMPETAKKIQLLKNTADQFQKIMTISGRVLDIPYSNFGGRMRVSSHKGVNYWNQGSAYDILADTLLRIHKAGLADAVYFSMHDELIVSTSAAMDIRKIMETPPERFELWAGRVPKLRTDMNRLGKRWIPV